MLSLVFPATALIAQEGPFVPCVGCEDLTQVPFPEPGAWYNPDQSGTGFSLEFQNGIMAGYYFGYDVTGEPEWTVVTSRLTRSEQPDVMWELEVEPNRFTGGNCLGCPYQAPNAPEVLPPIRIEFLQRAYARVTLNDGSVQFMVPIMYGEAGIAYFNEQTPWLFPKLVADPVFSLWTLVFKEFSEEEFAPWTWSSGIVMIGDGVLVTNGPSKGLLSYSVVQPVHPPEVLLSLGNISCSLDEALGEPGCILQLFGINPIEFKIPIGNFTDSRIFGEAADGTMVQGFRLQYD